MIKIKQNLKQERLDAWKIGVTDWVADAGGFEIFCSGLNWDFCARMRHEVAANVYRAMEAAGRRAAGRRGGQLEK